MIQNEPTAGPSLREGAVFGAVGTAIVVGWIILLLEELD